MTLSISSPPTMQSMQEGTEVMEENDLAQDHRPEEGPCWDWNLEALTNFILIVMFILVKATKWLPTFSPTVEGIVLKGGLKCSNPHISSFAWR